MITELILVSQWVAPVLQFGDLFGNEGPIEVVLDLATGGFSFLLFAITLYAWATRGKQPTMLLVSFGFLTFFVKQVAGVLFSDLNGELFHSVMDFLTLTLFFVALVVRPKRNVKLSEPLQNRESRKERLDL